jgi:pimeloyl-ACP methyl ester carboxylesterase
VSAHTEHIDGRLYWEKAGRSGRPIVFVHPNPMDRRCWLYQIAHFSQLFQTISVDLPGYGFSPAAGPGLTMVELAAACWNAVAEVTIEPSILVGLSTGSGVALYMAQQRPAHTLALVLSGARYRRANPDSSRDRVDRYRDLGAAHRYQHTLEDFAPHFRDTEIGQYFARMFSENALADADTYRNLTSARSDPERHGFTQA